MCGKGPGRGVLPLPSDGGVPLRFEKWTLPGTRGDEKRYPDQRHILVSHFAQVPPSRVILGSEKPESRKTRGALWGNREGIVPS